MRQDLSNLSGLLKAGGAYVGGLASAPKDVTSKLVRVVSQVALKVFNAVVELVILPSDCVGLRSMLA